jgi:pantoate--beta-alanine ligase
METIKTISALRALTGPWRAAGARLAIVPTMGALHAGHLSLVAEAKRRAERVVASIFVNPAQFAPNEDFARYPRDLARDVETLRAAGGVDAVYAPETEEMYPAGFATQIVMDGPAAGLETDYRPHFFTGVATVVAKLFTQARPDFALFGEKDYQQLLVVRRMARDLDLGVEVVGAPIAREADGLALSSRNAYLDAAERAIAGRLNGVLTDVVARTKADVPIPQAEAEGAAALLAAGFRRVDYVAIRDAATLAPLHGLDRPARVLAAAHVGGTRLIDNRAL